MRVFRLLLKLTCFAALLFVASGAGALWYVSALEGCPRLDEGAIQCTSPFFESVGTYGMVVVYVTLFTAIPAFLAIAGLVLLIRDLARLLRRRRVPPPLPWAAR